MQLKTFNSEHGANLTGSVLSSLLHDMNEFPKGILIDYFVLNTKLFKFILTMKIDSYHFCLSEVFNKKFFIINIQFNISTPHY